MPFQLVLATDNQITVWHTDHGHVYVFNIDGKPRELQPLYAKDIDDAPVRAAALADAALRFAEAEARSRHIIG